MGPKIAVPQHAARYCFTELSDLSMHVYEFVHVQVHLYVYVCMCV